MSTSKILKKCLSVVYVGLVCVIAARASEIGILPEYRIIVFKTETPAAQRINIAKQAGCQIIHNLKIIPAITCEFSPIQARRLDQRVQSRDEALSDIARVDKDYIQKWIESEAPSFAQTRFPNVSIPKFKSRPLEENTPQSKLPWGIDRVRAPQAWSVTQGRNVRVAVIDTGIDYNHPALKAIIKGGVNVTSKVARLTDTHEGPDFLDDNGHGSHVSGSIAAQHMDNGVVGVAPEVDLYGVKVLDANGSGTFGDVIAGIQWAADPQNHIDVANMSLGASRGMPALAEAVEAAAKAGLTIIAAAGNASGGAVGFPAAYPQVIAVSASALVKNPDGGVRDDFAFFSSKGREVAVIAPGQNIYSTYMNGGYETLSGTSMACPHAVGVAALAVAAKGLRGVDSIRAALQASATPIPGLTSDQQGAGLINAESIVH